MPAAGADHHVSGSVLDRIGRDLLAFVDYRVAALTILAVIGVFLLLKRRRDHKFPAIEACFKVAEACGLIATGLIVGCVFLLTNPPAVGELSHEARASIGLITLILTVYFGCKTIRDAYHHTD